MKTDKVRTAGHPSLATLHQLFDGLAVDAAAARHARDCPSCAHQLQALADQRHALGRLLHRDADWVSAAHRQGRAVLADLLVELARAALARREAGRYAGAAPAARSAPLSELPRPIESIQADIRTLVTRLKGLAASAAARGPRASRASDWPAVESLLKRPAADASLPTECAAVLRVLEGESPRWRELSRRRS